MLGLAFLGLTLNNRNFIVPAVILLSLGVGFLISAAIYYKLGSKENRPAGQPRFRRPLDRVSLKAFVKRDAARHLHPGGDNGFGRKFNRRVRGVRTRS